MSRRNAAQSRVTRALILAGLISAGLLLPTTSEACGGFFLRQVPGGVARTMVQDSERILFVRDAATKTTTVWVEVRYSGSAEDFAWLLPVPAKPTVGVGSVYLFDRLDQATAPRFVIHRAPTGEGCRLANPAASMGCSWDPMGSGGPGGGAYPTSATSPHHHRNLVTVLDESQVGPYDTHVLTSGTAEDLHGWLTTRGFAVPESAKPIIADHLAKGDVFVAVRLKRGASVDEIRPITLEMHDTEPCVPLRLTSIAAREDMAVTVMLAGEGRAVPKNQLHVTLNPLRLAWGHDDGVNNYGSVLASAIDEAGGRGFVTEYAGPMSGLRASLEEMNWGKRVTYLYREPVFGPTQYKSYPGAYGHAEGVEQLFSMDQFDVSGFAAVTDLRELLKEVSASRIAITRDVAAILEKHTGAAAAAGRDGNVRRYWRWAQRLPPRPSRPDDTPVAGAALAEELEQRYAAPMRKIAAKLRAATYLTRLAMRISPEEMDRDPIFAFNPDLPDVSPEQEVTMALGCGGDSGEVNRARLSQEGVGSWVMPYDGGWDSDWSTAIDPRFSRAPAALRIELLDESGPGVAIHGDQIPLVDEAIRGAEPGAPSVSPDLALRAALPRWTPPDSDVSLAVINASAAVSEEGCSHGRTAGQGHPGATLLALLALALASLLAARRATRDER